MKKKILETYRKLNTSKPILFESFCGDESEFGVCKDDILNWLSDHKQLYNDCERHFSESPNRLSADDLEGFISEHDGAFDDYCAWFEINRDEDDYSDMSWNSDSYFLDSPGEGGMVFDSNNPLQFSFVTESKNKIHKGKVVKGCRLTESTSSEYTIQQVDENKIRELENASAFTWEGMNTDDDNLQAIVEFFKEQTPSIKLPVHFFTWNGDLFNAMYGLTGSNAYPDDLTFLSIDLDNWKKMGNLPMVKMRVGARWLDDIVDNNARRQSRNESLKPRKLDEALPKDLMRQMRQGTEIGPGGRTFNYSSDYQGYWDSNNTPVYDKSKSGVVDYQNATYKEVTPQEILRMKKNGDSLENVYIMKDGKLLALDSAGKPDDRRSTKYARSNQSLKKSVENADKIYIVNAEDTAITQPDKMASRLRNREVRNANYSLGHNPKGYYTTAARKDTTYSQYANELNTAIARARKEYEDGIISRNEMEREIKNAKGRFASVRSWSSSRYQDVRNRNAENRYKDSELTLQEPFRALTAYKSQLANAKRYLSDAKDDLQAAQTGQRSGRWNEKGEYAQAKAEVERLTQQIANLQAHLARYQAIIDGGAQNKDIQAANDRIAKYSQQVQDTQDKINKLLRR